MAKETRIAFRASDEMKKRLAAAAKSVRLSETALAEACVEALIEYIEQYGEITFPLTVLPKSEFKKTRIAAPIVPAQSLRSTAISAHPERRSLRPSSGMPRKR